MNNNVCGPLVWLSILIFACGNSAIGQTRSITNPYRQGQQPMYIEPPTQSKKLAPAQPPSSFQLPPASQQPSDSAESNRLAREALQLMRLNRFDDAELRLRMAMHLDPTNVLARSLMQQLQEKREMVLGREVREKLAGMILDEVNFNSVPLAAVVDFITDESRKLDPEKHGVNFVLKIPESAESAPVTLKLRKASLLDVLKYACQVAGVSYRIEPVAVIIYEPPPPQPPPEPTP